MNGAMADGIDGLKISDENGQIKVHNFSASFLDNHVHFHVMKMEGSSFIWIGKNPELANLSVAMCTKYDTTPAVANLVGDLSDITSNTLAQKFAKKLRKQCFVSYNLPPENAFLELAEQRLIEEMNNYPQKF